MLTPQKPISSDLFHWHKDDRTFSQEISTLECNTTGFNAHARLYDDACDVGFHMKSHKTGKVVAFYHAGTDRDDEGDIQGWWFNPIPEHVGKNPRLRGVRVLIIND